MAHSARPICRDCRRGMLIQPAVWPGHERRHGYRARPREVPGHLRPGGPAHGRAVFRRAGARPADTVAVVRGRRFAAPGHGGQPVPLGATIQLVSVEPRGLPRSPGGRAPVPEADVIAVRAESGRTGAGLGDVAPAQGHRTEDRTEWPWYASRRSMNRYGI